MSYSVLYQILCIACTTLYKKLSDNGRTVLQVQDSTEWRDASQGKNDLQVILTVNFNQIISVHCWVCVFFYSLSEGRLKGLFDKDNLQWEK